MGLGSRCVRPDPRRNALGLRHRAAHLPATLHLVAACASAFGDSYCSLAWVSKLTEVAGADFAAGVLRGDDYRLSAEERAPTSSSYEQLATTTPQSSRSPRFLRCASRSQPSTTRWARARTRSWAWSATVPARVSDPCGRRLIGVCCQRGAAGAAQGVCRSTGWTWSRTPSWCWPFPGSPSYCCGRRFPNSVARVGASTATWRRGLRCGRRRPRVGSPCSSERW